MERSVFDLEDPGPDPWRPFRSAVPLTAAQLGLDPGPASCLSCGCSPCECGQPWDVGEANAGARYGDQRPGAGVGMCPECGAYDGDGRCLCCEDCGQSDCDCAAGGWF